MKKKLEAELISIAHRILKLKNKSELIQLHQETQKLYEKLSVLRFVEENFAGAKPTIGQAEIEEKIETAFETPAEYEEIPEEIIPEEIQPEAEAGAEPEEVAEENEVVADSGDSEQAEQTIEEEEEEVQPEEEAVPDVAAEDNVEEPAAEVAEETEEIVAESNEAAADVEEQEAAPVAEDSSASEQAEQTPKEEDSFFKPAFELSFEAKPEADEVKEDAKEEFKSANEQITFEDILGSSYIDPVFVKAEDIGKHHEPVQSDNVIPIGRNFPDNSNVISINKTDDRSFSLNDRLSKGITIGLNDRVAFMKHLFANSSEDYNRVLSQLITFDTFAEAQYFIDNMVKPDYNNWEGKDEYAERFMEIVEKKFS